MNAGDTSLGVWLTFLGLVLTCLLTNVATIIVQIIQRRRVHEVGDKLDTIHANTQTDDGETLSEQVKQLRKDLGEVLAFLAKHTSDGHGGRTQSTRSKRR